MPSYIFDLYGHEKLDLLAGPKSRLEATRFVQPKSPRKIIVPRVLEKLEKKVCLGTDHYFLFFSEE